MSGQAHRDFARRRCKDLQQSEVLMIDGHFDYGNGYHGRVYLNPHQLFRHPSTIWRFAQDLLDVMPSDLVQRTEVVAGPVTGGALLAHTIAGLLDSRRSLTHPPCSFAPFNYDGVRRLRAAHVLPPASSTASACCWPTTCGTPARRSRAARRWCRRRAGTVVATVEIYDRCEAERRSRRAEHRAGRIQGAGELQGRRLPAVQAGCRSRVSRSLKSQF